MRHSFSLLHHSGWRSAGWRGAVTLAGLLIVLLALLAACEYAPPATDEAAGACAASVAAGEATPVPGDAPRQSVLPTATPTPTPLAGRIVVWHSWAEGDGDALAAILEA